MKLLGIDFGTRRVGIAVSDDDAKIAFPVDTLEGSRIIEHIEEIIKDRRIEKIIIGRPTALLGSTTHMTNQVADFGKLLHERTGLPVEYMNEVFTTQYVLKGPGNPKKKDASAAAVILQMYIDKTP